MLARATATLDVRTPYIALSVSEFAWIKLGLVLARVLAVLIGLEFNRRSAGRSAARGVTTASSTSRAGVGL